MIFWKRSSSVQKQVNLYRNAGSGEAHLGTSAGFFFFIFGPPIY